MTLADDMYDNWVMTPQKEIEYLKEELRTACRYLAIAKRKLAPYTDNSDVDLFLKKHGGEAKNELQNELRNPAIIYPEEIERGIENNLNDNGWDK